MRGGSRVIRDWTPAQTDTLRRLWANGVSASLIALELGDGITRNAVLGKVHRLKLPGRVEAKRKPRPSRAKKPEKKMIAATPTGQKVRKIAPPKAGNKSKPFLIGEGPGQLDTQPLPLPREAFTPLPGSVPVDLVRMTECKWPVGEGPAMFCNLPRHARTKKRPCDPVTYHPYCETHVRLAKPRR